MEYMLQNDKVKTLAAMTPKLSGSSTNASKDHSVKLS